MLSFNDVRVERPEVTASKKRTIVNNEITKSEIYLIMELGLQRVEFDIEQPKGDLDKKNPLNSFFFYKYGFQSPNDIPLNTIRITLEERIYKLERDEAAFMDQMRQINTRQTTSIN